MRKLSLYKYINCKTKDVFICNVTHILNLSAFNIFLYLAYHLGRLRETSANHSPNLRHYMSRRHVLEWRN